MRASTNGPRLRAAETAERRCEHVWGSRRCWRVAMRGSRRCRICASMEGQAALQATLMAEVKEMLEAEPPRAPCAIASCPLPAVVGSRYCRGHARVMGS